MPVSCHVYEVDSSIDTSTLYSRMDGYLNQDPTPHLNSPLETDLPSSQNTPRGVEATIRYDVAKERGSRPGLSSHYRNVYRTPVRFTSDYFVVIGPKQMGRELSEICELLQINASNYQKLRITEGTILRVVASDSQEELQGWWDDIDDHTDTATIFGDVDQSSYAADFNRTGDVTYMKYQSQSHGGNIGLSANKDSVVFWTGDWSEDDMIDYIDNYII